MNELEQLLIAKITNPSILDKFSQFTVSPKIFNQVIKDMSLRSSTSKESLLELRHSIASGVWSKFLTPTQQLKIYNHATKFSGLNCNTATSAQMISGLNNEAKVLILHSYGDNYTGVAPYLTNPDEGFKNLLITSFIKKQPTYTFDSLNSFLEYKGNLNELDSNGTPLYFKIKITKSMNPLWDYYFYSDAVDFNLKNYKGENYLESVLQSDDVISLNYIKKFVEITALQNSKVLKNIFSKDLFNLRWETEKNLYPISIQSEILKRQFPILRKAYSESDLPILKDFEARTGCSFTKEFWINHGVRENNIQYLEKHGFEINVDWMAANCSNFICFNDAKPQINQNSYSKIKCLISLDPEFSLRLKTTNLKRKVKELHELTVEAKEDFPPLKISPNFSKAENLLTYIEEIQEFCMAQLPDFIAKHPKWKKSILPNFHDYPFELMQELLHCNSIEDLTLRILGKNTGFALNKFKTTILNNKIFNINKMFWAYTLTKAGFNYDLICSFLDTKHCEGSPNEFQGSFKLITLLKSFSSEQTVINLLKNKYSRWDSFIGSDIIQDCEESLIRLYRHNDKNAIKDFIKEASDLTDLHDLISDYESDEDSQEDFELNQEEILHLDNLVIPDLDLKFYIPKRSYDLIHIGRSLCICVGNGDYAYSISEGEIFIITLKNKKNELVYCIEVDPQNLSANPYFIQAKGKHNSEMPRTIRDKVKEFIVKSFNL